MSFSTLFQSKFVRESVALSKKPRSVDSTANPRTSVESDGSVDDVVAAKARAQARPRAWQTFVVGHIVAVSRI